MYDIIMCDDIIDCSLGVKNSGLAWLISFACFMVWAKTNPTFREDSTYGSYEELVLSSFHMDPTFCHLNTSQYGNDVINIS